MSGTPAPDLTPGGKDPQSIFLARQSRLGRLMSASGLEAVAINPGPTLAYLTGLSFHLMERPVVALFRPGMPVCLALPELEAGKTSALPFPIQVFPYGEDPQTWPGVIQQAVTAAGLEGQEVGVEPTRLRFLELRLLETAAPRAKFISGEACLSDLRMVKDGSEVAAMQKAVDIAQRALQATLPQVKVGLRERELASELVLQLLRGGSEPELPFAPIVSGGPNSANPHAVPSDRPLAAGDLLVIDWGAAYGGYISDLTRTFAIGQVEPELARVHQVVQQANEAGRAASRPGATAGSVDQAAREVIEKEGYGPYFIHRTGHGIGMEGHEGPYIRSGNPLVLSPGMTYTVEPGIYLPGRGGVRIEDNVAITETGAIVLSSLPRELVTLG